MAKIKAVYTKVLPDKNISYKCLSRGARIAQVVERRPPNQLGCAVGGSNPACALGQGTLPCMLASWAETDFVSDFRR